MASELLRPQDTGSWGRSESIIGTRFTGHLVREVQLGEYMAVQPVVTGEVYITGIQQCVVDPCDPLKYEFSVGNSARL
jgi:proline racemase